MTLGRVCGQRLAIERVDRETLRPDRTERGIEQVAGARPILLGGSASDVVGGGAGEWPLTGAVASIGAR